MTKTVKITVDGTSCNVEEGITIFNAAKGLGYEIPHFCYHPKLSIAGNCRLCQVEVEGAKGPVISCRERVREGMVVRINSQTAKQVRRDVLEFILINHPLDCPVCDQSGECKLQDQYFNHSLQPSRMQLPKVHKPKMKRIGPEVMLDDERCVLCTRCIRFCDEVAGEHQLMLRERGDHSTIDVAPGKELDNPYSLCTVDICPVGALTAVDFRFKKRVWFLTSTPSICTGCATGCNIWLDHCDSIVYRYRPRDNESVNQCWMCDAGRMTYKPINAEERVLFPLVLCRGELVRSPWDEALTTTRELFANILPTDVVVVLSAEFSLEENMAFARLFRDLFSGASLVWSGRTFSPSFADAILRDADQNPNAHGVELMTTHRFGPEVSGKAFVILGHLAEKELASVISQKPRATLLITDTLPPTARWADVVLPRASHAEQEGTLINRAWRLQKFSKAFEPRGESVAAWTIAERLASSWEKPMGYHSAEAVFEAEKQHYKKISEIVYLALPAEGVQL